MKIIVLIVCCTGIFFNALCQPVKILFDGSKAETASNADWIPDADLHNLGFPNGYAQIGKGDEANPQIIPSPAQSGITSSTSETYWSGALSYWAVDCVKSGYTVESLPYNGRITYGDNTNTQDLKNYALFIVCEPNIKFTTTEKTALINFVLNGGGLFMISDHTASDRNNDGYDSPAIWNDLMTNNSVQKNPFGISFDLQDFSQTSSNIPNLPTDSILHGSYGSVTQVLWTSGTSMTLSPTANSTVKGIVYKTGSSFGNTSVLFAHGYYGKGKFAAIGDSSPCDDGTGDANDGLYNGYTKDAGGNHRKLLMNATIWLVTHATVLANNFLYSYLQEAPGNTDEIKWAANAPSSKNIFVIQTSTDGRNFYSIDTIAAYEGSHDYLYHFISNNNQKEFIRIALVEDGSAPVYSATMLDENKAVANIQLLQNPVHSQLQLLLQPNSNSLTVYVYSVNGQLIIGQTIAPNTINYTMDAGKLSPGMYKLILKDNKNIVAAISFLKE